MQPKLIVATVTIRVWGISDLGYSLTPLLPGHSGGWGSNMLRRGQS
jgi:hypothetical protein